MLNSMLFVMIAGAVLFMILSIKWDSLVFGILDVFLWFIIAAAVHSIEIPYVAITSSDAIVTGYHEIQDLFYLKTLFIGIGLIMLIYVLTDKALPVLQQKFTRMM